ncbi:MAG TPA: PQQ-binding-like beta-propeller repeat protein, partial [Kofleriaceae bacterium]|nr:PQQ-binding-like beta-propeller repeat protein [Kofleriaceae bacterium]
MKRVLVLCAVVACGPSAQFRLTSSVDNDRSQVAAALAARQLPEQPTPENAARRPRVFVVIGGPTKQLAAYDLAGGNVLWKVPADVTSRVWVGGDFVVDIEQGQLVARSQQNGATRWRVAMSGEFVGAAADRERAYATWRVAGTASSWRLAAFDGASGDELWHADADGQLGAPAAQGGLVYSPYLSQWLSLVDGKTGKQLARLRGLDEQISIVRATSTTAYYGSKRGMFVLDARSAAGSREGATYGRVQIPAQLDRASYGRDLYDPIQIGYTAADRARVLWTGEATDAGAMKLEGDRYAVHYFRYVFGFSAAGDLVWAYQHPRVELVASDSTGAAIVGLGVDGELVALDPKTGAVRATTQLGVGSPVLGATFDADGWTPGAGAEPADQVGALVSIALDHDARFDRVKELAVTTLAKLPGGNVTNALLSVLADARAPQKLKDTVSDLLARRRDPSSIPALVQQLAVHADYITGTQPDALGAV